MTRTERYLARLAGQDVSIPDTPITREEQYLAYIIQNGGGVPAPNLCATDVECWLQDYISATSFMSISMYAGIYNANISNQFGVRPYFCLGKAPTP